MSEALRLVNAWGSAITAREHVQAGYDMSRELIRLAGVEAEAEAAVKQARIDAQKQIDALLDAADEWSGYVVEDTAPRTLSKHLEQAIESLKGKTP